MFSPTVRLFSLYLLAAASCARADDTADKPKPLKLPEPETRFDITADISDTALTQPRPQLPSTGNGKELHLSSDELLQNPQLLHRALVSVVELNDLEGLRVLLPIYRRLPEPKDTTLQQIAEAMLAQADGKFGAAADDYREALAKNPDMSRVRLYLAQSLFEDQQDEAARDQFTRLRADNTLPEPVRQITGQYLDALDQRGKWTFSGSLNYIRDNNVNNAGKVRKLYTGIGEWTLPEPESAQGISYSFNAAKDWRLAGHWKLRTDLNGYGKFYWDNHKYDDLVVRFNSGPVYKTARSESALLPYFERRWYGTEAYSRESGMRAEWQYWLTPRQQFLLAAEAGSQHHDKRRHLNGKSLNTSATWLFVQNPRQYWTVGADWSRKSARDPSDAYRRHALRASWTHEWGAGISSSLGANIGWRRYDDVDFFNVLRQDKEYSGTLSLWSRRLRFWGVTPRLVMIWQKTSSNHVLYSSEKRNAFIQFNKTF